MDLKLVVSNEIEIRAKTVFEFMYNMAIQLGYDEYRKLRNELKLFIVKTDEEVRIGCIPSCTCETCQAVAETMKDGMRKKLSQPEIKEKINKTISSLPVCPNLIDVG
jgi:hypothetical protein